jgi:hypothetical protein
MVPKLIVSMRDRYVALNYNSKMRKPRSPSCSYPHLISPQHTADGHDVPSNVTDRLTKKRAKIAKNKRRLALTYSPIELSDVRLPFSGASRNAS